ncbi:MAG: hypothetical protein FWG57_07955 [Endomicrobia bacterium]|nr:hypothetical protein [Endomicrobiia bacterium]
MKKILFVFTVIVFAFTAYACSNNPASSKEVPPAPKPDNFIDAVAVAAKKADFYVRLSFDLADGYLSDNSVVRRRYGRDNKYVNSLEFGQASITGKVFTSHISGPIFWYLYYDVSSSSSQVMIPDSTINNFYSSELKRQYFIGLAETSFETYQYNIDFTRTDILGELLSFSVVFSSAGHLTAKGADINIAVPFDIDVHMASGDTRRFGVTVNVQGSIKGILGNFVPSPAAEFVIESGQIVVTGTDPDFPNPSYEITLNYSSDAAAGIFKALPPGTFTADYTLTKDEAYYIRSDDPTRRSYIYWDYPL